VIRITNTVPSHSKFKGLADQECNNLTKDVNRLWPNGCIDTRPVVNYVRNHTDAFSYCVFGYRVQQG